MPDDTRQVHYFNVSAEMLAICLLDPVPSPAEVQALLRLSDAAPADLVTLQRINNALGGIKVGCYVNFDGTEEWKTLEQYRADLIS